MSSAARDSSLELSAVPELAAPLPLGGERTPVDGRVVGCACPDCRGPMTVRLWLMTADCWQCGASIELTLEQEQALRRQMRTAAALATASAPAAAPPPAPPRVPAVPRPETARAVPEPPPVARVAPPPPPVPVAAAPPELEYATTATLLDLTAWMISAVLHAVLILLLGMWTFAAEEDKPELVLSATLSKLHRTGGEPSEVAFDSTEFELPLGREPKNKQQREALLKANQEARELRLQPGEVQPKLPSLDRVKANLRSPDPYRRMQAARDPRVRTEIVRREGGTTLTEAAVARGLRWMAAHQAPDGSWSLHDFHTHGDCNGRCGGRGKERSDTAATSLVLMAMLGTGQTHQVGIYRQQVSSGLAWLLRCQKENGDLRSGGGTSGDLYSHALSALVLCDALKMTGDETLRGPAQRAVDFIAAAQATDGGWRYEPRQPGDTSVAGWQLMALHSARSAYLDVPEETLEVAGYFLDRVQADEIGSRYRYQRGRDDSATMTSVGLLSRMYLGWNRSDAGLVEGVEYLARDHLPTRDRPNIYYWYYATQVMHHWGEEPWERWNRHMREALVLTQEKSGHEAGSWPPTLDPHGSAGGRLYVTALATCTLEVYYRYAPLYHQIELD